MNRDKIYRTCRIVLLALLTNLLLATSVMADTHWVQGIVTKAPWQERYRHIMIDNKLYTFMPEATFTIITKNRHGDYDQAYIRWQQIKKGQNVSIDIQGRRIYQLTIQK